MRWSGLPRRCKLQADALPGGITRNPRGIDRQAVCVQTVECHSAGIAELARFC
jgi:hypothetical protein